MADRLTQLQDLVNQTISFSEFIKECGYQVCWCTANSLIPLQAENFCNAIGILQQVALPSKFSGFDRGGSQTPQQQPREDYEQLFAMHIVRTAKDIDAVIDSLPNDESSLELQIASLRRLEQENQTAAIKLREEVKQGETLQEKIQNILSDIAQHQLDIDQTSPLQSNESK